MPFGSVQAGAENLTAGLIVNAAGAWADEIAALAGISRVGLTPAGARRCSSRPRPGMDVS